MIQPSLSEIQYGTYTPTTTGITNVASSGALLFQFSKIGDVVTMSGTINIVSTASGSTVVEFTLPVPMKENLTSSQVAGMIYDYTSNQIGEVYYNPTTQRAVIAVITTSTTSRTHTLNATYRLTA